MKLENVRLRYVAFHKPFSAQPMGVADARKRGETFGAVIYSDDNSHLSLPWKPSKDFSLRFTLRSNFAPVITFSALEMYPEYKAWCDICDMRQLGRDVMFRGATVDLEIAEFENVTPYGATISMAIRNVIVVDLSDLNHPHDWEPAQ